MKKVGIVTIIDNNNYGNRLQNYALSTYLNKLGVRAITLKNEKFFNHKATLNQKIVYFLKYIKFKIYNIIDTNIERRKLFKKFNKNIEFSKTLVTINSKNLNDKYDYFIVGSDQVWKPNYLRLSDFDLLSFAESKKRISYAASFGISNIPKKAQKKLKIEIEKFKSISVRENTGKEIIENISPSRNVDVLIDPTMLLSSDEWDKVISKPKILNNEKYILNYFLGTVSDNKRQEIERIAKENNCIIIDILDKSSPFYNTGPSEFLYLEKNAFLICTDSFHSSVFSIIFNKPFIIFEREEVSSNNMNSRIDTLLEKFNLQNRKFTKDKIIEENLTHDYTKAYKILEKERQKSKLFLEKALDIKESDENAQN